MVVVWFWLVMLGWLVGCLPMLGCLVGYAVMLGWLGGWLWLLLTNSLVNDG